MSAQAQRRERKRRHDREAQRQSRERTKTRVRELEELVETLKAANECPERISNLLLQIRSAREENTRLRERMRRATELLALDAPSKSDETARRNEQQHQLLEKWQSTDHAFPVSEHGSMPLSETDDSDLTHAAMQFDEGIEIFGSPKELPMLDTSFLDPPAELQPYHYRVEDLELHNLLHDVPSVTSNTDFELAKRAGSDDPTGGDPVVSLASTILKDPTLEGRFWLLAGTVLNYVLNMSEQMITPRALDDDIVIRSIVEGWDTVSRMYWLDAGWRWLRQLDEYV
jgi:hypothetical protein